MTDETRNLGHALALVPRPLVHTFRATRGACEAAIGQKVRRVRKDHIHAGLLLSLQNTQAVREIDVATVFLQAAWESHPPFVTLRPLFVRLVHAVQPASLCYSCGREAKVVSLNGAGCDV